MNALTTYCQSNIYAVVDKQRNVVCFAFFVQFLCRRDQDASV
jgi:hypothetical protein